MQSAALDKQKIPRDVLNIFEKYPWPGNIRELEHVIESACVISEYDILTIDDFPDEFKRLNGSGINSIQADKLMPLQQAILIVEEDMVKKAYQKTGTSYGVAEALQISQSSAWRKIQKYCL